MNNKMTKDTIPEGFTLPMAFNDLLPVLFFGLSGMRIGGLFYSRLFFAGAVICVLSGMVKVLWKMVAAVSHKNIWWMFVQMRVFMPVGFLMMLAGLVVNRANLNGAAILAGLVSFPACIFFGAGALGMALMVVFSFKMDSSSPKANWIEQFTNGMAQLCFFIGLLLV